MNVLSFSANNSKVLESCVWVRTRLDGWAVPTDWCSRARLLQALTVRRPGVITSCWTLSWHVAPSTCAASALLQSCSFFHSSQTLQRLIWLIGYSPQLKGQSGECWKGNPAGLAVLVVENIALISIFLPQMFTTVNTKQKLGVTQIIAGCQRVIWSMITARTNVFGALNEL